MVTSRCDFAQSNCEADFTGGAGPMQGIPWTMLDWRTIYVTESRGQIQNSLARAILGRAATSDASEALDPDRIVAHAAGAIVMADVIKVLAGNKISADQLIGIDAGIVILGNERSF